MNSAVNVAVIFGGRNTEHDVSFQSAAGVLQFLDRARYRVVPIRITRHGMWLVGTDRPGTPMDVQTLRDMTPEHTDRQVTGVESLFRAFEALRAVDVVLPCLHGPHGAAGTLQSVLELAGVPYVGSGVAASAMSMDKEFTKKILAAEGITVADGVVLRGADETVTPADRDRLGLPASVRPARGGSSIGLSRVGDWTELDTALAQARSTGTKVLVEGHVPGQKVDIGVLELPGGEIVVSPSLEVKVAADQGLFDSEAEYRDGTEFIVPAELDDATSTALQETAMRVFRALGCAGLLQVSFLLAPRDGRIVPTVNEVNTIPSLTAMSQFPRMWQAAGTSYSGLLDLLLRTALHGTTRAALAS